MAEKSRRAYLVAGPESSGTRFLTGLLIDWGCKGNAATTQAWDSGPPKDAELVVWRRSFPHGHTWPDLVAMAGALRDNDYKVFGVIITRDWYPMLKSQVAAGHTQSVAEGAQEQQKAYPLIFGQLAEAGVPFVVTSYEGLVHDRTAAEKLSEMLGFGKKRVASYVRNENWKHYAEDSHCLVLPDIA